MIWERDLALDGARPSGRSIRVEYVELMRTALERLVEALETAPETAVESH